MIVRVLTTLHNTLKTGSRTRGWWRRVVIFTFRALYLRYPLQRRPVWGPRVVLDAWIRSLQIFQKSSSHGQTLGSIKVTYSKPRADDPRYWSEWPVNLTIIYLAHFFVHAQSYTSFWGGGRGGSKNSRLIPLQAWTGLEGSRLRLPDFQTNEGGKVASPTQRPPLPPRK